MQKWKIGMPYVTSWSKRRLIRCGLLNHILCETQLVRHYFEWVLCACERECLGVYSFSMQDKKRKCSGHVRSNGMWGIILGGCGWVMVGGKIFWVGGGGCNVWYHLMAIVLWSVKHGQKDTTKCHPWSSFNRSLMWAKFRKLKKKR